MSPTDAPAADITAFVTPSIIRAPIATIEPRYGTPSK
jgi:hypothetical protein